MKFARRILGGAMLFVACSAAALIACRDIERPADLRGSKPVREQEGPPVVLALTCELDGASTTISCASPSSPPTGVDASVIYGSVPGYAQFYPVSLVKDTVAHTWQFTAYLQNLLKQSIGTLDGTTVTGVKIFITDFHATAGTGTVSVANADGTGNFTAPNQPYFNYNQIVAPSGYTSNKLWKFNVPNTVTAVSMSILVSTDFPAEQSVAIAPPATVPDWIRSDTNVSARTDSVHVRFVKHVIKVGFRSTATLADRQLAVAYVNGTVVGGILNPDGTGYYYVQLPNDVTGANLFSASRKLRSLPQVESAHAEVALDPTTLKPSDGGDWNAWTLSADTVDTGKQNWALEMISAPFAWGCSTGDPSTLVGIVDHGFRTPADLTASLPFASYALSPPDASTHATYVAGVLAASANNGSGITGTMWSASLQIEDAVVDPSPPHKAINGLASDFADRVLQLGQRGVRVVNISYAAVFKNAAGQYIAPSTYADSDAAAAAHASFIEGIAVGRKHGLTAPLPLLVLASGDFGQSPGTAASTDSWWAGLPQIADDLGDTVLVVGASTRSRTVAYFSGVNVSHGYVSVMAPGDSVYTVDPSNHPIRESGTSVAAPYVTGTVGLLLAFDPTLGAPSAGHGPPELKRLILAGADSSRNTSTGVQRKIGAYRFLNAYEALKEVARRPGAPLCGNRVYGTGAGRQIVAQRGTSTEVLVADPALHLYAPAVYHGGNQFTFLKGMLQHLPPWPVLAPDDTGSRYQCFVANRSASGTWAVSGPRCDSEDQSVGAGLPPLTGTIEGTANSLLGRSHNGDSSVTAVGCTNVPSPECFNIFVNGPGSSKKIAQLTHTNPPLGYTMVQIAYSPYGDRALIELQGISPGLVPPGSPAYNIFSNPQTYSVRLTDGQVTTLSNWVPTTGGIMAPEISEDGQTVAAGFGVSPEPLTTNQPCHIEYRSYSGSQLSPSVSIPNNDACMFAGGVTEIKRAPGAFGRRVASASVAPVVGQDAPKFLRSAH